MFFIICFENIVQSFLNIPWVFPDFPMAQWLLDLKTQATGCSQVPGVASWMLCSVAMMVLNKKAIGHFPYECPDRHFSAQDEVEMWK
jgi:hypothetical protein